MHCRLLPPRGGFLLSLVAWMQLANSVAVPTVRFAQCNDLRNCSCYSPHTVGYCKSCAVDFFYSDAPAIGYVVFSRRFVGLVALDSGVEDGFLCVVACTPRRTLY